MQEHHTRAPAGGIVGWDRRFYEGGEFVPYFVPRAYMPQIREDALSDLIEYLGEFGIAVVSGVADPKSLRPHQRINHAKSAALSEEALKLPVLVSADDYILDGHHRWLAHTLRGTKVPICKVMLPFNDALEALLSFPEAYESEEV